MNKYTISPASEAFLGDFTTINGVKFTPREVDVISYLYKGKTSTKIITAALSIAPKTLETYIRSIFSKTQSHSRESVIDFIKKSDKSRLIHQHYQLLQNQALFQKIVRQIHKENKSQPSTCLIVYDQTYKPSQVVATEIEDLLKQAGLNSLKQNQSLTNQVTTLVGRPPPRWINKVIYIVPDALLLEGQPLSASSSPTSSTSLLPKDPSHSNLFILIDRKETTPLPHNLPTDSYIDLTERENCYAQLLSLLKKLTPFVNWKNLDREFPKDSQENEKIPLINPSSPSALETPPLEQLKSNPSSLLLFLKKLYHNKTYRLGSIVGSVSVFLLSLAFLITNPPSKSRPTTKNHPASPSVIHSDLTIPMEPVLLNRPDLLNQIAEKLTPSQDSQKDIQSIVLVGIAGMGGVGKTTIARQFGRSCKASVVWEINAETHTTLMTSFKDLAYELAKTDDQKKQLTFIENISDPEEKEKQLFSFVRHHLKQQPDWLLIYDNVDNFAAIKPYLPHNPLIWGYGKVIITTRDANIKHTNYIQANKVVHMEELSLQECLTLFCKILYKKDPTNLTPTQKEEALAFLQNIPPFPLDVSAAAYYIKNNRLSYPQYLERIAHFNSNLEKSQQTLLKEVSNYAKTRYGVITSSLAKVIESNEDFGDLLVLVCLIDSQNIPRSLLEFYKNPALVDSFIHNLKKYSLITHEANPSPTPPPSIQPSSAQITTQNYSFSIHRSTQNIGLNYLTQYLNLQKNLSLLGRLTKNLEGYMIEAIDKEDLQKMKVLVSHCEAFLAHPFLTPSIKVNVNGELGAFYYYLGNYKKAKDFLEISHELYAKDITKDYSGLARVSSYLGLLYRNLGENTKAKDLLTQALDIYTTYFPADYLKIVRITSFLGDVYRNLGEFEKARDLLKSAVAICKRHLPENHIDIAWASVYLANVYKELGEYQKAKDLLEKSLAINRQHLPEDHFRVARTLSYLGNVYRKLGDYQKAKNVLEKSFVIHEKQFSKNSIKGAWVMVILGSVYKELGNYQKAKDLLEKSLSVYEEYFLEDHIDIAWALARLGNVYKDLKDYTKAKGSIRQSLVIYEKYYGENHIKTARILKDLGLVYLLEGELETAEGLLVKAFKIFQQNKHPEIYISLEGLADLFLKKFLFEMNKRDMKQAQNFKKQAINYLEQALVIVKNHFPPDSTHIARIQTRLNEIHPYSRTYIK